MVLMDERCLRLAEDACLEGLEELFEGGFERNV